MARKLKWGTVLLCLLAAPSAYAEDCHKLYNSYDFVHRALSPAGGIPGCYPTADALKEALWAKMAPIIEAPIDYPESVETSVATPGRCFPSGFHDVLPYPIHKCTYTINTTLRNKRTGETTYSYVTDSYFDVVMDCGGYLNSNWRPELDLCMRFRDERPTPTCTPNRGNPIGVLTGLKSQRERIAGWGRGHELVLSYSPNDAALGIDRYREGPATFGRLWHSNLNKRALINGDLYTPVFMRGDGTMKAFGTFGATASSLLERDRADAIRVAPGGWLFYDTAAAAVERYEGDKKPELARVHYADGRFLDFVYGATLAKVGGTMLVRVVTAVNDEAGRGLAFEYEPDPEYFSSVRLKAVTDAGGQRYTFEYGNNNGLIAIGFVDGTSRRFRYENASFPWALTALVDEAGETVGRYDYDAKGRAVSTATGTNGERWNVTWSAPPEWTVKLTDDVTNRITTRRLDVLQPVSATATGPAGRAEGFVSQQVGGSTLTKEQTQPAGAGCEAASSSIDYDAEGNATRRVDFNGGQSCHAYVAGRHLESSRVEGMGAGAACSTVLGAGAPLPAGARKFSSQWHPDWRMATRTAEPRRITTLVYNGQPDPFNSNAVASCAPASALLPDGKPIVVLCKRVEQATTDETGAQGFNATLQSGVPVRSTSWTYDATGQVLTETDPRGKVVVTNEYYTDTTAEHTKGDLKSSTNSAGHLTQFPRYNAYGKPLEVIDANLVSTTYAYDARQRLTSVSTGGSTTSYEYWPTGLLKKTTQPDGAIVTYEYDDAHRLTAVADGLGNRIEYTLDQSGNRTAEAAKDPQGTLKRTMSRVFDALGRAQQTTGRE